MLISEFRVRLITLITPVVSDDSQLKSYWDYLANGKLAARKVSELDEYKLWLFAEFSEIQESRALLEDIVTMLVRLNSRKTALHRMRMLSYHIHNYLEENYVLENRLVAYPKQIFRKSKRWNKANEIKANDIVKFIRPAFSAIKELRGYHTHEKRFTDNILSRLTSMERSLEFAPETIVRPLHDLFRLEFGESRKNWITALRAQNIKVDNLMERYFDEVAKIVFHGNDELILPSKFNRT